MSDKLFLNVDNIFYKKSFLNGLTYSVEFVESVVNDSSDYVEEMQRKDCNVHFYCISVNSIHGFLIDQIAKIVNNINQYSNKLTILQVIPKGFTSEELQSLDNIINLVKKAGNIAYKDDDIERATNLINLIFKDDF